MKAEVQRKLPKLNPDWEKLLEVILFLIKEAQGTGAPATQYQIVKSIFVADERHLNEYGRPIVYCNYSAMENGPVPSEAFDMLKPEFAWSKIGLDSAPWRRVAASSRGRRACEFMDAREPNLRKLSKTDVDHLRGALATVRHLGFGGTKDFTHKHPAYKDAWKDGGDRKSFPMDYQLLLSDQDPELLADIIHASKHR